MALVLAKVLYHTAFADTEKGPSHLDQGFPSCGACAIMINKVSQSDIKRKTISLHKMVWPVPAAIAMQGGKWFPVPERGSAQS